MSAVALDGVLVVDKPEGPTSHDVVDRVRRAVGQRQIGHTGTLDPMATGVLALVLGHATRLTQFLAGHDKQYDATIRLGVSTDTWDRTGDITARAGDGVVPPAVAEVQEALRSLIGPQDQLPPPYSAKKIRGVRAHTLARQGRAVEVQPARVTLHRADLVEAGWPLLRLRISCSAGYYVRALADTLGRRLGCGGCLEGLRRTGSGAFSLADAVTLEALDAGPAPALARLVPLSHLLPEVPSVVLTPDGLRRTLNGNPIGPDHAEGAWVVGPLVRLFSADGRLVAMARPVGDAGLLHPAVVLK